MQAWSHSDKYLGVSDTAAAQMRDLFLLDYFCCCFDTGSHFFNPGCPRTHCVAQVSLKLMILLLLQPPECWNYRYAPQPQLLLLNAILASLPAH